MGKSPEDLAAMQGDLGDARIAGFAVFDLGGTQSFSKASLAAVARPILVIGAPEDIQGLDLDIESRALVAMLPKGVTYLEPETLAHFDFLGLCTEAGFEILKEEEPEDAFVCEKGRDERRADHAAVIDAVTTFFGGL